MSFPNIETTKTADFLTISIPIKNMNSEEIEDFVAFVKSGILARKSELSEAEAEKISEEIKESWWEKNKSRIEKMIGENE